MIGFVWFGLVSFQAKPAGFVNLILTHQARYRFLAILFQAERTWNIYHNFPAFA
jgi:hypothetical protein